MKKISILFAVLSITVRLLSIPATPYPVKITQADGSEITIRLHGDEFFNYKTTTDGYLLISDDAGILNYAEVKNGKLTSTNVKASDIAKRSKTEKTLIQTLTPNRDMSAFRTAGKMMRTKSSISSSVPQKAYPLNGSPKALVILVNFSDIKFSVLTPQTAFTNSLNQSGYSANGGTGSAKDYFHDASNGAFNPQFDVIGPVTLDNTMAYYGANDSNGNDVNPQQMISDACKKASSLVDFSQYDFDNNGMVDNVFVYYAGYNEAEGGPKNSIWPHKWNLPDYSLVLNGKIVFHYACTSELRGSSGTNMCGIGTFCHEFGHVLGLDDYYDTSASSDNHHTLSVWNIMDYGAYLNSGRTPPTYCAYDRYFLTWLAPIQLSTTGDYSLENIATSNKAYMISQTPNRAQGLANDSNSPEYFTLENRQNSGWDKYLPNHGMIVYHIYYNSSTWASNGPNNSANAMGVDIVEADGIALPEITSLDPTLAGDPFPGTSNVTTFTPILRNGTNIKKPVFNISDNNGIIRFRFGNSITLVQNLTAFKTVQGTPSTPQIAVVNGSKLKAPIVLSFKSGLHYEMKKDTDPVSAWAKTLTLIPTADSLVVATNIQIRYNPTVPSFNDIHYDTFVASNTAGDYADASISGTSTRPVYVSPPVATDASSNSFTGFVANWDPVYDATGYYATVFYLTDGQSNSLQTFDAGLVAPAGWTITASATSSSTVYSGANPPSVQFQNTGEYVQTEKYMFPVTSLSFYVRSMGAYSGGFLIQAKKDDNTWEKVDSIAVSNTLYEKNKSYTFPESKGYNRFKFIYYKGVGSITFDDVKAGYSKLINYVQQDQWITSNSDTLTNLTPGTQYFYKVKASDKSIYYENITDVSNTITATTTIYPFKTKLISTVEKTGDVTVYLPTIETTLYVYDLLGNTVKTITPQGTVIKLTDLPKNHVYILKAGSMISKIAN